MNVGLSFRALVTRAAEGRPLVSSRDDIVCMQRLCIALLSHCVYPCFVSRFSATPSDHATEGGEACVKVHVNRHRQTFSSLVELAFFSSGDSFVIWRPSNPRNLSAEQPARVAVLFYGLRCSAHFSFTSPHTFPNRTAQTEKPLSPPTTTPCVLPPSSWPPPCSRSPSPAVGGCQLTPLALTP